MILDSIYEPNYVEDFDSTLKVWNTAYAHNDNQWKKGDPNDTKTFNKLQDWFMSEDRIDCSNKQLLGKMGIANSAQENKLEFWNKLKPI